MNPPPPIPVLVMSFLILLQSCSGDDGKPQLSEADRCRQAAPYKVGDVVAFVLNDTKAQIVYVNCHYSRTYDVRTVQRGTEFKRIDYVNEFELKRFVESEPAK